MGNRACCCTSDGSKGPEHLADVVNPRHSSWSQAMFFDEPGNDRPKGASMPRSTVPAYKSSCSSVEAASASARLSTASCPSTDSRHLLIAVGKENAAAVLRQVAEGADMGTLGEALCLAARRGSTDVVRELVAVGMSVNVPSARSGLSPLQLAASGGHFTVCELLLDAMADVHDPSRGPSALAIARQMGHHEVEEVLERHSISMLLEGQGAFANLDMPMVRGHAHVLPRVSPLLSKAVLQIIPLTKGHEVDFPLNEQGLSDEPARAPVNAEQVTL